MRQAYRRPIVDSDLTTPIQLYQQVRNESGDFEAGIEQALAAILVNPNFLLRIERQPELETNSNGKPVYRLTDIELASRLSFFLWSSIPDEELLRLAESRQLSKPDRLQQQVLRMLEDRRADALVNNFADQWLYLRNLDAVTPDARLFPDFDHNLREAFRRETELLFAEVVHEDQSIFSLIDTDHTYLNERLAAHYDIPHVQGSHFRRVELGPQDHRGGILRHGSILSVTSYATRTSPVLRGKWILENLLGTPPPPPPANVAALDDNTVAAGLPVRQRLAAHRANTACSGCHNLIDPVGFSLENFDAVGRWRETELGQPVDASGGLPDGSEFLGIDGLERALKQQPDLFARTVAEKLLTYAVGRGLTVDDAPAVRQIVRSAKQQDYRFSSFIVGIAQSVPFQLRAVDVRSPK